jgi:hypothetical protein
LNCFSSAASAAHHHHWSKYVENGNY